MAQLKFSLKTNIIKSLFFDIYSNISKYYYAYGRSYPWETVTGLDDKNQTVIISNEDNPPAISQTHSYELSVRKNILYTKAINSSDSAIVIRRINWTPGLIYDMYDDYNEDRPSYSGAATIDQANFYVLTTDFNVYKCLFNNYNKQSQSQPSGTSTEPVTYADGYIWKFMYTIPLYLRNKFLTTSWMPCTTSLTNQFYSNGSITSYSIESKGLKYSKNTWKVKRINIISGGAGYKVDDVIISFQNPDIASGVRATAQVTSVNASSGSITAIAVTNSGSGYKTQPIPTFTQTQGSGLVYTIDYEADQFAYTVLKITGDGYNAENPFSLKSVTVTNRGMFLGDEAPAGSFFTFPPADFEYGYMPEVTTTFRLKEPGIWEVDEVIVTNQGFGYESPLIFGTNVIASVLQNGGFSCNLNTSTQKNEAELVPLINDLGEIEAIQIKTPGKGYTYATVDVVGYFLKEVEPGTFISLELSDNPNAPGYLEGFKKASIILNFGLGDIETKQSNVELLAVDGAIPIIVVENGGSGYASNTTVTVTGDGTGCEAIPIITNGTITSISVTNPGSGYTFANAVINGVGSGASLRTILPPSGGHGKDAVAELYANTIMLTNRIGREKVHGLELDNDYRQIVILKKPKAYNDDNYYIKATGTACALAEVSTTIQNIESFNRFQKNDTLSLVNDASKTYVLVNKYIEANKYYLLLQMNSNQLPAAGNILVNQNSYPISISSVTKPDINKYSGEMLYIDNRVAFASSADQTIVTTTLISF